MQNTEVAGLSLTESVSGESTLGKLAAPGVYGDGLLTVPTIEDADGLLDALEWDFIKEFEVLAHNAFGDLFLRSTEQEGVFYLWMQWGRGRQVAGDPEELFERILVEASHRAKFLETAAFDVVSTRLGPLRYGTVFTLNPVRALGGDGDLGSCEVGRLDVYLSIISQSFETGVR